MTPKNKKVKNTWKWICIEWLDAHSCDDWMERRDVLEWAEANYKQTNRTFGEKIGETKNFIIISASSSENKNLVGDVMMIPKCMIRKIKRYK